MRYADEIETPSGIRKWLKISAIFLALVLLGKLAAYATAPFLLKKEREPTAQQMVTQAVGELRPSIPARLNEFVTVVAVEANGAEMIQRMSVSRDLTEEDMPIVRAGDQRQVCGSRNYTSLLRKGGVIRFIYEDVDGDKFESRIGQCRVPVN